MKFSHKFNLVKSDKNTRAYQCGSIYAELTKQSPRCLMVKIDRKHNAEEQPKVTEIGAFGFGDITVNVNPDNLIISYYKGDRLLFSDREPLAYNLENEFGEGVFHYISREKSEKVYGLGDKSGYLNKAGKSYTIETTDSMGYDAENSDPLYKHVPFYICENPVGCYGIEYLTSDTAYIDLGREHNNYYKPYKYFRSGGDSLTYFVYFGTKLEILQQHCAIVGGLAFPPKWSFDYCASTMAYTDAPDSYRQMLGFIEQLKKYDLSCRGFYLSSGYTSIGDQRCVFNWNYDKFPDPAEFIRVFRENGIEIIPNIKPAFLVTHPMYKALAEKGLFIKNPDGTPFVTQFWDNLGSYLDFTNPETKEFWKRQVTEKLLNLGITSTWNDNNEFDIKDPDAVAFHGNKSSAIRPELTYLMVESSYEAQMEKYPALRPFLSTRSGGAKIRRYAQTWSGDNYTSFKDLKFCHFIGLTMSLSGFYFYGHDLGGFSGSMPSRELLLRWLQHGVFEPRFTIHSWNDDGTATMPWSYPDIIQSVRKLFAQRARLIPYLYASAYNAVKYEIPMNAPLFLYYDDEKIDENGNTFMVGRDILAACIFDENEEYVEVYLPKADDWYSDGDYFNGGTSLKAHVPADSEAKCFIRAGSVIPVNEAEYGFKTDEKLVLNIYAADSGSFSSELFFDDGESFRYLDGDCALLNICVDCGENEVTVTVTNLGKTDIDYGVKLTDYKKRTMKLKK
ncbi:MAG: DUF5110 domain-containing protein [Eubacterium sp.]|nr:DUF5110 domain-containing protein [Eubacterium sp.]